MARAPRELGWDETLGFWFRLMGVRDAVTMPVRRASGSDLNTHVQKETVLKARGHSGALTTALEAKVREKFRRRP